jgi:predicted adenine nucleotide alpha hydrolase (AANH) superfamily ATPase
VDCLISAPSGYEGKFSKANIKKKEFEIRRAYWDYALEYCPCGYTNRRSKQYIQQLKDKIRELENKLKDL